MDGVEHLVVDTELWPEQSQLQLPAVWAEALGSLSRDIVLTAVLDAIRKQDSTAVAEVAVDAEAAAAGTSAPLLVPLTSYHISLKKVSRTFVQALFALATGWAVGGLPGPGEVAAVISSTAVSTFIDRFIKLSDDELEIARFIATRKRAGVTRDEIEQEFGPAGFDTLDLLEKSGIVRKDNARWHLVI